MNYIFKLKKLRIGRGYIVMIQHKVVVFLLLSPRGKFFIIFSAGEAAKEKAVLLKTERKKKEKILTCNNAITAGFPLNKNEITKK